MMDFEYRDGAIVAIKPPPGITPNFENPETKAPQLISVVVGFLTVTSFFVLLRVYTRIYISKAFGIDDCKAYMRSRRGCANLPADFSIISLVGGVSRSHRFGRWLMDRRVTGNRDRVCGC